MRHQDCRTSVSLVAVTEHNLLLLFLSRLPPFHYLLGCWLDLLSLPSSLSHSSSELTNHWFSPGVQPCCHDTLYAVMHNLYYTYVCMLYVCMLYVFFCMLLSNQKLWTWGTESWRGEGDNECGSGLLGVRSNIPLDRKPLILKLGSCCSVWEM